MLFSNGTPPKYTPWLAVCFSTVLYSLHKPSHCYRISSKILPIVRCTIILYATKKEKCCQLNDDTPSLVRSNPISEMLKCGVRGERMLVLESMRHIINHYCLKANNIELGS